MTTPPPLPPPDPRLTKLDTWLKKLHNEQPLRFNLLVAAVVLVVFGPVLFAIWWTNAQP